LAMVMTLETSLQFWGLKVKPNKGYSLLCSLIWNYIYIHRVLSPIFLLKLTWFLSETIKCMCVAKLVWSDFSALRPASMTNIDFIMRCFTLQHYHVGGGI
jgi:hypothetical protein